MSWTPERVDLLRSMALDGASATQIGNALGISRNAAQGKAFRIGVRLAGTDGRPMRPRAPKPAASKAPALKYQTHAKAFTFTADPKQRTEPKPVKRDPVRDPLNVPLIDLQWGQCRAVSGSEGYGKPLYCGHRTVCGPWCEAHAAVFVVSAPKARKHHKERNAA